MSVGTVRGREIKKNRDGLRKVRVLRVEITDPDDLQDVEHMQHAGVDSSPINDSKVFVVKSGEAWKIAVGVNDNIEPKAEPGEYEIYSNSDGQKPVRINLKPDGTLTIEADSDTTVDIGGEHTVEASGKISLNAGGQMVLQGGGDNAVRFSELKTAFDQLKSDHDKFLNEYKLHTHTGVTPGGGSTGTTVSTQANSTADINPSKVDNIEVP